MGKLINRIPGSCLLIPSLPGSASRTHVDSRSKPRDSTSILEALPGKLDIKRHSSSIPVNNFLVNVGRLSRLNQYKVEDKVYDTIRMGDIIQYKWV